MTTKFFLFAAVCFCLGWAGGRWTASKPSPAIISTTVDKGLPATPAPAPAPDVAATPPVPVPTPPTKSCETKETVRTVYLSEGRVISKDEVDKLLDKSSRDDVQRSAFRSLKYMTVRPYRDYRAYRAYKTSAKEHGGEKDCQDRPYDLKCSGTVAACTREPNSPQCFGTRAHCLRTKDDKYCQGTEVFCKASPHHKSCMGTGEWCTGNANRPECAGTLEFCQKRPLDDGCYGTEAACSQGKFDQDLCTADDL